MAKKGKATKNDKLSVEELEAELGALQRRCRELGMPVLIVMEGLNGSGKGIMINRITLPLDPRWFKVTCISAPNEDERMRPFLLAFLAPCSGGRAVGHLRSQLVLGGA